jgi:hypothetical protein
MLKRLYLLIVMLPLLLTTGCIAVVVGAGVGAGAFAYFDGQLSRTYEAKYETTYQVCKSILKDLKQPILEEKADGIQTTIKSERTDGTRHRRSRLDRSFGKDRIFGGLEEGNLRAVS